MSAATSLTTPAKNHTCSKQFMFRLQTAWLLSWHQCPAAS